MLSVKGLMKIIKRILKTIFNIAVIILFLLTVAYIFRDPINEIITQFGLRRYASIDMSCSQINLSIFKQKVGYLVEGCNKKNAYIKTGCCDSTWYMQCKNPKEKQYWTEYCYYEMRDIIDICMEARKLAEIGDVQNVDVICKEYDKEHPIPYLE